MSTHSWGFGSVTQGEDELTVQCRAKVGQTLQGKWTLADLIGVGGMAAVYLGKHRNGATAAIKLLHAEYAANWAPSADGMDRDELIAAVAEAVNARNGWKRILRRCM